MSRVGLSNKYTERWMQGRGQHGFTIIELMLSMLFVSFILVFMALTIVQMLRIYDKSVSMKQVNQAGRTITEDISIAMRSQSPAKISTENVGSGYLCVGPTVYVWKPLYTDVGATSKSLFDAIHVTDNDPVIANGSTMVRKVFSSKNMPCEHDNVYSTDTTKFEPYSEAPLLSSRSRVVWASIKTVPDNAAVESSEPKLVELTFIIGTYSAEELDTNQKRSNLDNGPYSGFTITPHREKNGTNANITCLPGNDGNFCAFAEFKTVIYVSGNNR